MALVTNLLTQTLIGAGLIDGRFNILHGGSLATRTPMRWDQGLPADRLRIYGFEADKDRARELGTGPDGAERHEILTALWSHGETLSFHVNDHVGDSSVFAHNETEISRWTISFKRGRDGAEIEVPAISVAEWAEGAGVDDLDFVYLNVEGSELSVLQGMGELLDRSVGVVAEVNFIPTYFQGAPLFSDIDKFLATENFTLFGFLPGSLYVGRHASAVSARPATIAGDLLADDAAAGKQLFQTKALYLRDPIATNFVGRLNRDKVLKLVCMAELYGQVEFAFELAKWISDGEGGAALSKAMANAETKYMGAAPATVAEPSPQAAAFLAKIDNAEREIDAQITAMQAAYAELEAAHAGQVERMSNAYSVLLAEHLKATGVIE